MKEEESLFILLKSCLRTDLITAWGRIVLETAAQGRIGCKQAGKKLLLSKTAAAPLGDCLFNLQTGVDLVGNSQL